MKKNNPRSTEKYPGLKVGMHPKARGEYIDQDYIAKLSPKEKAFLSKFNEEYYGASLAKESEPKKWKKDLHKAKEERKECRDRNNARNRDIISHSRTRGWLESIDAQSKDTLDEKIKIAPESFEDAVIDLLDAASLKEDES